MAVFVGLLPAPATAAPVPAPPCVAVLWSGLTSVRLSAYAASVARVPLPLHFTRAYRFW